MGWDGMGKMLWLAGFEDGSQKQAMELLLARQSVRDGACPLSAKTL